jgi:hypothetical protein
METACQNITNYFYALTKIVPYRMQANDKISIDPLLLMTVKQFQQSILF